LIKFFQRTKAPTAHLLYYEILSVQQSLFNTCLQFASPAPEPGLTPPAPVPSQIVNPAAPQPVN
jgi:hypothetical protein